MRFVVDEVECTADVGVWVGYKKIEQYPLFVVVVVVVSRSTGLLVVRRFIYLFIYLLLLNSMHAPIGWLVPGLRLLEALVRRWSARDGPATSVVG
eukprot:gene11648-8031_t